MSGESTNPTGGTSKEHRSVSSVPPAGAVDNGNEDAERQQACFISIQGDETHPIDSTVRKAPAASGLSNADALSALCRHLQVDVVDWYRSHEDARQLSCSLSLLFRWGVQAAGVLLIFFVTVLLATGAGTGKTYRVSILVEAVLMGFIIILNLAMHAFFRLRYNTEVLRKVSALINWAREMTDLARPDCPGLSMACSWLKLSAVVRDGRKLLLPSAVLVPGDIVLLLPDQAVPCSCTLIPTNDSDASGRRLQPGQTVPIDDFDLSEDAEATASPVYLRIEECIAVNSMREALMNDFAPMSTLEHQVFLVARFLWQVFLPTVYVVSLLMQGIFLGVVSDNREDWSLSLLVIPAHSILPLLPVSVPLLWDATVMFATAKLLLPLHLMKQEPGHQSSSWHALVKFWIQLWFGEAPEYVPQSSHILFNLGAVTTMCCVDKIGVLALPNACPSQVFFFGPDDAEGDDAFKRYPPGGHSSTGVASPEEEGELQTSFHQTASRSASVNFLGPNLESHRKTVQLQRPYSASNACEGNGAHGPGDSPEVIAQQALHSVKSLPTLKAPCKDPLEQQSMDMDFHMGSGKPHVLDITYRFEGSCLEFDDVEWAQHMPSLKPLGLNSILNHNFPVAEQLDDNTGLSILLSDLASTHVVGKECLCDLGMKIGFLADTHEHYTQHQRIVMSALRAPPAMPVLSLPQRTSSMYSSAPNQPSLFHLVSKMVSTGGSLQLLTQGSGELVLEASSDYFNGEDICGMTPEAKTSIQEFFSRHALQAHCVACSYRPLSTQMHMCTKNQDNTVALRLGTDQPLCVPSFDTVSAYSECLSTMTQDGNPIPPANSSAISSDQFRSKSKSLDIPLPTSSFQRVLSEQIFIGMVALQYLPREDVVRLVEDVKMSGIRFVYFSSESEQRSRVFSNRLGIETGWNCHISLKPRGRFTSEPHSQASSNHLSPVVIARAQTIVEDDAEVRLDVDPGAGAATFSVENGSLHGGRASYQHHSRNASAQPSVDSAEDMDFNETARLPCGVDEIRPHLETVDNVPLQVPLFTDCQHETVREMIRIMQENGETVCCIGSSLDMKNAALFLQANIGLAVQPELPNKMCMPVEESNSDGRWLQLATRLCTLPCSIVCQRDDPVHLTKFIGQARASLHAISQYFLFLTGCYMSLSVVLMLGNLLLLPPPLSGLHILWFVVLILPLLALTILCAPEDPGTMTQIPSRSVRHDLPTIKLLWNCLFRFFPLVLIAVICHGVVLDSFCRSSVSASSPHGNTSMSCRPLLGNKESNSSTAPWHYPLEQIALAQEITAFVFLIFCSAICLSFYQCTLPLLSYIRDLSANSLVLHVASLLAQLLFTVISMSVWFPSPAEALHLLASVHPVVWVLLVVCLFALLVINELVKHREHRLHCREQRRAKLIFETKLGMNSPI